MEASGVEPRAGRRVSGGPPLLVVAGEASGDQHAARVVTELRRLEPELAFVGLGGDELAEAGLEAVAHSREIAVVGITEAIRVLPRARQIFAELLGLVDERGIVAALLVDFPEFNLRLARRLTERGVRVVYYISPQVWAWRPGRVRRIARVVDRMLVFFPFEADFYRRHGVDVVHVGHPLVDEVPQRAHVWESGPPAGGAFHVALLPGSRRSEVDALMPVLLGAAERLARRLPEARFRLLRAATVDTADLERHLTGRPLDVEVVSHRRLDVLADCHLALCASGTATLEVGLVGTPMIVVYRVGSWTWFLARLLVRLPHVSLVNLVLERGAVPELLQGEATPERISTEAAALVADEARVAEMRRALGELRARLGRPGASRRAAREVARELGAERPEGARA